MPAIPATIVSKVDASGVRTITEYGTNEKRSEGAHHQEACARSSGRCW